MEELLVGIAPPLRITSAAPSLENLEQQRSRRRELHSRCRDTSSESWLLDHGGVGAGGGSRTLIAGLEGRRRATQHLRGAGDRDRTDQSRAGDPSPRPAAPAKSAPVDSLLAAEWPPLLHLIVRDGASTSRAAGAGDRFSSSSRGSNPAPPDPKSGVAPCDSNSMLSWIRQESNLHHTA